MFRSVKNKSESAKKFTMLKRYWVYRDYKGRTAKGSKQLEESDLGEKGCFQEELTGDMVSELAFKETEKLAREKGGTFQVGMYNPHITSDAAVQHAGEKGMENHLWLQG